MMVEKHLSDGLISYMRDVDTTFRNDFETSEMRQLFLENVFREIEGCELKLIVKKSTSSILENLVSSMSPKHLLQLLKVSQENLDEILCSTSGCHILKQCLRRLVILLDQANSNLESDTWKQLISVVLNCCSFFKNENDLILWLTESSQAFQSLVAALGGCNALASSKKKKSQESLKLQQPSSEITVSKKKLPPKFVETFEKIVSCFVALKKVKIVELLNHDKAAPCICCMLKVANLCSPTSLELLCDKLLAICKKDDKINDWSILIILVKDRIASHVIESVLESDHKETIQKLINILAAKEHLVELACHPVANFVVQKLIVKSSSLGKFENIFEALVNGLEDILAAEKYGIVQKLAEQSVHVAICQSAMLSSLLQTFHCIEEKHYNFIVSLIASYSTYDVFFDEKNNEIPPLQLITYHGSLLLQTLLKFDDPSIISDSMTNLPTEHVVKIACHASGSHIIDSFFNSSTVKDKSKLKFIENHRGQFNVLARDRYGNKVLWNMWTKLNLNMKVAVAESLLNYEDLKSHRYGKYVLIHFRIRDFVEKRENWNKFQMQQQKKRKVFDEFLNTGTKVHKAKKRR